MTWEYGAALMAGQIQHHMVATQLIGSSALKLLHSTKAKHEHRLRRAQHVGVTQKAKWTRSPTAQQHRSSRVMSWLCMRRSVAIAVEKASPSRHSPAFRLFYGKY